jgi:hypothetical protein
MTLGTAPMMGLGHAILGVLEAAETKPPAG